ncbi:MAG: protein kinase [Anaerolineales bacterium]|nr:protein kinase [Anaerolineales bacterium]
MDNSSETPIVPPGKSKSIGRYPIHGVIGRGGMAIVYHAREPKFDRDVAIKILPPILLMDPVFKQRFLRETKILSSLEHSAIVPVYDFGEEQGQPYLVMRYLAGGSLLSRIGAPFSLPEATRIIGRVGLALDAAHSRDIIHRDVKPGNILFDEFHEVYLSDFGIARISQAGNPLTGSQLIGTPTYMSPEQIEGGAAIGPRSDIYSLGIVLFEALCGQPPFAADSPAQVLMMHLHEPVPSLAAIRPDLSPAVGEILQRALAKDPASRFDKASDLGEALKAAAVHTASMAAGVSTKKNIVHPGERMKPNPFTFGNPIREPERFYGRKAELRQIVNRLLSSAHESTSIVGERRIGKTSLLTHLSNPQVAAGLGLTPDKFCVVYVDFQGLTDITPQRFWQRILEKISRTVADESMKPALQALSKQAAFDLFDLEDLFESAQNRNLTTVLLMDEFEYVTQNSNFTADFFGGLRALAIHHGLALIPATRRELVDLCHSNEIKGSPFFNIFSNVVLYPFPRSDVELLFDGYSKQSDCALAAAERDFLWNLAGGYPFLIQMAGYFLVEGKTQGLSGEGLIQFVSRNFDQQADSHYSYLWSHCSESEKITLLTVLILGLQKPSQKTIPTREVISGFRPRALHDLDALGKRGMVEERDGRYVLFSASLARWIQQEVIAEPGDEEDQQKADEWLSAGGLENLKEIKGVLPKFKNKYWKILAELGKDFSINFAASGALELIRLLM